MKYTTLSRNPVLAIEISRFHHILKPCRAPRVHFAATRRQFSNSRRNYNNRLNNNNPSRLLASCAIASSASSVPQPPHRHSWPIRRLRAKVLCSRAAPTRLRGSHVRSRHRRHFCRACIRERVDWTTPTMPMARMTRKRRRKIHQLLFQTNKLRILLLLLQATKHRTSVSRPVNLSAKLVQLNK